MVNKPIIIYKNRRKHREAGYTRNAMWKVAYADFITAMMAFFLLLWLLSVAPEKTLKGVAEYFTATKAISDKAGLGFEGGVNSNIDHGIGALHSAASSLIYGSPSRGRRIDQASKSNMMTDIEKEYFLTMISNIQQNIELKNFSDNINIAVTKEGLQIQIMDSDNRPMFKPDTSELQPYMLKILTVIGKLIKDLPNYISISGHTASVQDIEKNIFDYWNLSAQRANEVRKFLIKGLIKEDQVIKILGMANKEPFDYNNPYSPKNIRVGITLLNNQSISHFQRSLPDEKL